MLRVWVAAAWPFFFRYSHLGLYLDNCTKRDRPEPVRNLSRWHHFALLTFLQGLTLGFSCGRQMPQPRKHESAGWYDPLTKDKKGCILLRHLFLRENPTPCSRCRRYGLVCCYKMLAVLPNNCMSLLYEEAVNDPSTKRWEWKWGKIVLSKLSYINMQQVSTMRHINKN